MQQWFWPQPTSPTSTKVRLARGLHVAFYALGALLSVFVIFGTIAQLSRDGSHAVEVFALFIVGSLFAAIVAGVGRGIRYVLADE